MSDDPIDFSPLDLKRDRARFEHLVGKVMAGLTPRRPVVHPLVTGLTRVGGAALAVTALFALAVWAPQVATKGKGGEVASNPDGRSLLSEWAQAGHVPEDADVTQLLGGFDAP